MTPAPFDNSNPTSATSRLHSRRTRRISPDISEGIGPPQYGLLSCERNHKRAVQQANRGGQAGDRRRLGDFFGAILAGLLLGLLADRLLGTAPLFVVLGVVAGFGVGFLKMYEFSKKIEDQAEEARKERDGL